MYPILFRIGPITFKSYGFMLAFAFVVGILLAYREARRRGLNPDLVFDLVLYAAIGGIVGARLSYVIGHSREFLITPLRIFAIWEGGLVFYGGLAGGTLAVILFIWLRKLPLWEIGDMIAPCLALGYAIGRIGCFLNGCCYGRLTNLPWGVNFFDVPRHPTQIYSSLYSSIIFGILWSLRAKIARPGILFWLYVLMYSTARFGIEFLRESPRVAVGLTASQFTSIGIFILAVVALATDYFSRRKLS
ncbi:MAG: prolipoprotein diacylglyceryl transferase [Actinomycetota bacterium]